MQNREFCGRLADLTIPLGFFSCLSHYQAVQIDRIRHENNRQTGSPCSDIHTHASQHCSGIAALLIERGELT